jgi:hypothetical protein
MFCPFGLTFANRSPLLTSFFFGMSEKMGFWQEIREACRGVVAITVKTSECRVLRRKYA